ncbi:MAG: glycosyltransferase family 4 protein [Prolixibacteraceae bacterium]|jgi:glycosyltransferase involved in cell wall biosynthesis|nr:glycosyltransferase family 4 protein [Prolixibacteraceae bacterium]
MNIIQIIPGSGGSFYCGNCLRDSKFVDSLKSLGHTVVKVPMYLPLFSDEHDLEDIPVFYGAISIYLKQLYPIFRKAPAWVDRLLNSKPMMKLAAGMAGSTNAKGLEEMTISMLLGEEGEQSADLDKMVDWIGEHCKPDVIHLSNALLLGLARRMKEKLNVPVVCSLQDEDVWVDVMKPSAREHVWKLMGERAKDVDAFIAVSEFYAKAAQQWMNLPSEKLHTVHLGVDPADYPFSNAVTRNREIGYISRMNAENGTEVLIDAFILLKKEVRFNDVHLHLTGGSTGEDVSFIKIQKKKLEENEIRSFVHFWEGFEGNHRKNFLKRVQLLSVPVLNGEAFGIYLTEAMASGIPVVQPALGAFPEITNKAGGGLIYKPNTPVALAKAWMKLLDNPKQIEKLSNEARKSVENHFDINTQAEKLIEVYMKL